MGNFRNRPHNNVRVACWSFDASALSCLAGAMKHLLGLALLVVSFSAARSGASEAVPRMVRGAAYLEVGRTTRTLGFVCPANGEGCATRRHTNRRVERCRGKSWQRVLLSKHYWSCGLRLICTCTRILGVYTKLVPYIRGTYFF